MEQSDVRTRLRSDPGKNMCCICRDTGVAAIGFGGFVDVYTCFSMKVLSVANEDTRTSMDRSVHLPFAYQISMESYISAHENKDDDDDHFTQVTSLRFIGNVLFIGVAVTSSHRNTTTAAAAATPLRQRVYLVACRLFGDENITICHVFTELLPTVETNITHIEIVDSSTVLLLFESSMFLAFVMWKERMTHLQVSDMMMANIIIIITVWCLCILPFRGR
jgi:hypothetical protein